MNSPLQFDFLVDKEKNTLTIIREFQAGKQLVWDCYTKAELLNQWFAPKPLSTKTKSMDFREGGHWHYAMINPSGMEYWGWTDYVKIQEHEFYTALDGFSNEAGDINAKLPRANWMIRFADKDSNSMVETIITYNSLQDLETVLQMGMKEGLTATLTSLDDLLLHLQK